MLFKKWIYLFLILLIIVFLLFFIQKNKQNNITEIQNNVSLIEKAFGSLPGEKPITENIFAYNSENRNDHIEFNIGKINFDLERMGNSMETDLTVAMGGEIKFAKKYNYAVNSITKLRVGQNNVIVINYYSGGAHCCSVAIPYLIKENEIIEGKGLYLGNSDVFGENNFFTKGGRLFALSVDDRFAYYEMSFVDSAIMGFPSYHELSLEPFGFRDSNSSFLDIYKSKYLESQQEIRTVLNNNHCITDQAQKDYVFALLVRRYTLGYFCGTDREKLKNELATDWSCFPDKDLNKVEPYIFETLTKNSRAEDFLMKL